MIAAESLNAWAEDWSRFAVESLVEASLLLAVVAAAWLVLRRRVSAQLGYCLFLLVLVKAVVPIPLSVPERFARFSPGHLATHLATSDDDALAAAPRATPPRLVSELAPVTSPAAPVGELEPGLAVDERDTARASSARLAPDRSQARLSPQTRSPFAPPHGLETAATLTWSARLMLAWAAIVALLLLRFGWVQLQTERLIRRRRLLDGRGVAASLAAGGLDAWRRLLGVRRCPSLVESDAFPSPAVWGLLRPRILLPSALSARLPPEQLGWLVLHELAHIRRGDLWVALVQRLVQIVYFFNPAIWLANRMIDGQREYACDDAAIVAAGCSRRACGEAFLAVVERAAGPASSAAPALGLFNDHKFLRRRLMRILDSKRSVRGRLSLGAAIFLLGVAAVTLPRLHAQPPVAEDGTKTQPAPAEIDRREGKGSGSEVEEMLKQIEARLHDSSDAAQWTEQLEMARKPLGEDYEAPTSDRLELHVVGLYQGAPFRPDIMQAEVKVTHRSAPIVLCLTAYCSVSWHVELAPGVRLRQVILGGYERQAVTGLGADVSVADYSGRRAERAVGYAYTKQHTDGGDAPYRALADRLRELTALEVSTFQGRSRPNEGAIVVGPASKAWREERALEGVRRVFLAVTQVERERQWREIRQLTFQAFARQQAGALPHEVKVSYGEHTVLGPIQGKLRQIRGNVGALAVDPRGPTYYTQNVDILDPQTGSSTSIDFRDQRGEHAIGRACGLAFDTKRNRLIAAHLYGSGYMYAYSPDEKKWTPIRDMDNVDLAALCYSAKDDVLYGVGTDFGRGPTLYAYHPDGAIQKEIRLRETGLIGSRGLGNLQMCAAGDYLVLLVPSEGEPGLRAAGPRQVYVVDPRNGEVLFTHRQLPPLSREDQERAFVEQTAPTAQSGMPGHLAPEPALPTKGAPVRNPGNGHYYERIQGYGVTWEQAKKFAESQTYKGMRGYLATITSKEENDFLVLQWGRGSAAWIGASDSEEEGEWKWVTGPEAGTVFWSGYGNGRSQGYHNWARSGSFGNEPNNSRGKEHYGMWNSMRDGSGAWNDSAADQACDGILIEYSADSMASGSQGGSTTAR